MVLTLNFQYFCKLHLASEQIKIIDRENCPISPYHFTKHLFGGCWVPAMMRQDAKPIFISRKSGQMDTKPGKPSNTPYGRVFLPSAIDLVEQNNARVRRMRKAVRGSDIIQTLGKLQLFRLFVSFLVNVLYWLGHC
jgi:hypothetical protein